jgi:serine/threonine protein kinase
MGVVYRAHDTKLDRMVALKMLLLGIRASPEAVQRFQREAPAAAGSINVWPPAGRGTVATGSQTNRSELRSIRTVLPGSPRTVNRIPCVLTAMAASNR